MWMKKQNKIENLMKEKSENIITLGLMSLSNSRASR